MKIEELVPPKELCKQIPEGAFVDSALEWNTHGKTDGTAELQIRANDNRRFGTYCPAPTLQEIMLAIEDLGFYCPTCYHYGDRWVVDCEDDSIEIPDIYNEEDNDNPATAALNLWLELRGGVEK